MALKPGNIYVNNGSVICSECTPIGANGGLVIAPGRPAAIKYALNSHLGSEDQVSKYLIACKCRSFSQPVAPEGWDLVVTKASDLKKSDVMVGGRDSASGWIALSQKDRKVLLADAQAIRDDANVTLSVQSVADGQTFAVALFGDCTYAVMRRITD